MTTHPEHAGKAPDDSKPADQPVQQPQPTDKHLDSPPQKPSSEWKLAWLKEIATVLIAFSVVAVSGWLIVNHYFGIREFQVTEDLLGQPALYAAKQSSYQQLLSSQKDVLNYVVGVLGVVLGYFFGRAPAELRAKKAEDIAQANAGVAVTAANEAEDAKEKLADTKQTLSALRRGVGGTLSAGQQSELDALVRRLG